MLIWVTTPRQEIAWLLMLFLLRSVASLDCKGLLCASTLDPILLVIPSNSICKPGQAWRKILGWLTNTLHCLNEFHRSFIYSHVAVVSLNRWETVEWLNGLCRFPKTNSMFSQSRSHFWKVGALRRPNNTSRCEFLKERDLGLETLYLHNNKLPEQSLGAALSIL